MKTGIILCSNAGLTEKQLEARGWGILPIAITIDTDQWLDGIEVDYKWAVERMNAGKILKTSQPSPGQNIESIETALKKWDQVIYVTISSDLSGTYKGILDAAANFKDKVRVINSEGASIIQTHIAEKIQEAISNGEINLDILEKIGNATVAKFTATMVPHDLKTLKRGGRITPAAALMGNLLKVKPVLQIRGKIDKLGKARGLRKAYKIAIDKLIEDNHTDIIYLAHFDGDENIEIAMPMIREMTGKDAIITTMATAVAAHTGPGTLVFFGFEN